MSLASRLRKRTRAWARRRHGRDREPFVIPTRRVYILPTRLGLLFSGMLFLMFLGSMNYANNLALGLTFLLGSIGLIAMHHCHRNLAGIGVNSAANDPVFAGDTARLRVALTNDSRVTRYELAAGTDTGESLPTSIAANERALLELGAPTRRRGQLFVDHIMISTNYPFGLFRAWTHIYLPLTCIVYPKPSERIEPPTVVRTDIGGIPDHRRGDDDFAGLRGFQVGDSPRRIAWKAYARGQELQVKQYSGTAAVSHVFDFDSLIGLDVEARLSVLCRWIEDAHAAQQPYGLRLPGLEIETNVGATHRQRCLTALALFGKGGEQADAL